MRLLSLLPAAFALFSTIAIINASLDIPAVKRAANVPSMASKQSMLLNRKYTAKESVKRRDGRPSGAGQGIGFVMKRANNGMVKKSHVVRRNNADAPLKLSQRQVGFSTFNGDAYDMVWKVPVQLYNGKTIYPQYDTGSSVTIFNHNAYRPSSLSQDTGYTYEIEYLDGTVGAGEIYLDYITVAGLTLWSTVIWADTDFYDGADGILGVGFEGSLAAGSIIESMVQNFTMLNDVICMTMTAHSQGALQFGALDANIVEELQYTDALVKHAHAWDTTAIINGIGPFNVMIDTGTTYAYLPTKTAEALFKKLGARIVKENHGKGTPVITWGMCPPRGAPALSVMIGTIRTPFKVSPKNAAAWGMTDCRLSFVGTDQLDKSGLAIFGAAFLKNVHFVMDRGAYKMGFSQRLLGPGE